MVATWGLLKRSWDQIGGLVGVYSGPAGARNQHESHIKNMPMYRHDLLGVLFERMFGVTWNLFGGSCAKHRDLRQLGPYPDTLLARGGHDPCIFTMDCGLLCIIRRKYQHLEAQPGRVRSGQVGLARCVGLA